MATDTTIEWTHRPGTRARTWNPTRGCSRISPGCENCYAEQIAGRFSGPGLAFEGFATRGKNGGRWTRKLALLDDALDAPLRWREPSTVFVNSMSDLFHESLSNEEIAAVFGVMAASPKHTFLALTKRAKRMREWFEWSSSKLDSAWDICVGAASDAIEENPPHRYSEESIASFGGPWPLPNVWLGVSVESQEYADERIPHLIETPAAVRFLSCEPLLGPLNLHAWLCAHGHVDGSHPEQRWSNICDPRGEIGWVIAGGESGPGARPMELEWARSIVRQCAEARVPAFVKQLGAIPILGESAWRKEGGRLLSHSGSKRAPDGFVAIAMPDSKGGTFEAFPSDLQVRQFPEARS
jgi:protein gp37